MIFTAFSLSLCIQDFVLVICGCGSNKGSVGGARVKCVGGLVEFSAQNAEDCQHNDRLVKHTKSIAETKRCTN